MSTPSTTQQTVVHAILPHPQENTVCLVQTPHGWALPHITLDQPIWIRATAELNNAFQARLGFPVVSLYCLHYHSHGDDGGEELVYVLEQRQQPAALPAGATWFGPDQIAAANLARPQHAPLLAAVLHERQEQTVPPLRRPWSRPGWFHDAAIWMAQQLAALGYELLGPVEQTNSWCLSCILSAPTSRGRVFLKTGPDFPLFVNEPRLVAGLSTRFPHNVPTSLQIDAERRWMLLADFGPALAHQSTPDLRSRMLHQFARIQQAAATDLPYLLQIGCIDRRLTCLQQQVDQLLSDAEQTITLPIADLGRLRRAAPHLKALCDRLAAIGIPETLNHGDLHLGNVAHQNGNLIFFDWTDACIAHPFLDMISIFDEKDEALQTRLRDDYLAHWQEHAAPHQLREAWAITRPLSALHQAVSYQSILMQLEETPKQAFGDVVAHYVRQAVDGAERL